VGFKILPTSRSTRATLRASTACRRGGSPALDEETIREFLAAEYPRLVGAVALVCGSRAVAEDAVEEALARAWERSERGERIESLRAWVAKVALNIVRSGFRRLLVERRVRARLVETDRVPTVTRAEMAIDLVRALKGLPRRQREATILRYYLDMDVREIADALGVKEGTAKTTLHRARNALAVALGESHLEEADDVAEP
jgi:RNA polymerase sigma-70 factor, ECF subfamily